MPGTEHSGQRGGGPWFPRCGGPRSPAAVGLARPDGGRIVIDGIDLAARPEDARARVSFLAQRTEFPATLTVREILAVVADLRRAADRGSAAAGVDARAAFLVTGLAFLSIATLVASVMLRRGAAVGMAAFIWFFTVILYDTVMLGIALRATGTAGARVLFVSVFGNVVDLVRVLTLLAAGTPHVLGAAGESWVRGLGGPQATMLLAVGAIAVWIVAPLAAATKIQTARDL